MFSPRMKMADIISANHNVILLLPRFGIPLGFGDKAVYEVCASANVPVGFMLLVCNLYTFDDYMPSMEELSTVDMTPLVPYLKASHCYYTDERLPHIQSHIANITERMDSRTGSIFKQFYADFRREITAHFQSEEQNEFPRLCALQNGQRPKGLGKKVSSKSHSALVDTLDDITQIVYKYLPANTMPEETIELLFDILQLSSDIQKHALIEEKILDPYVSWLENGLLKEPTATSRPNNPKKERTAK